MASKKGLRERALSLFLEHAPARLTAIAAAITPPPDSKPDEKAIRLINVNFRNQKVMGKLMEEFPGTTLSAAATHYNYAFQKVRAETPDLTANLGRPLDKLGGRKKKAVTEAAGTALADATAALATAGAAETGEAVAADAAAQEAVAETPAAEAVAETAAEVAAEAVAETPVVDAAAETAPEVAAEAVAETPAAEAVAETPAAETAPATPSKGKGKRKN